YLSLSMSRSCFFPTRRSSVLAVLVLEAFELVRARRFLLLQLLDLGDQVRCLLTGLFRIRHRTVGLDLEFFDPVLHCLQAGFPVTDRKSTRLNSSHVSISYAVF